MVGAAGDCIALWDFSICEDMVQSGMTTLKHSVMFLTQPAVEDAREAGPVISPSCALPSKEERLKRKRKVQNERTVIVTQMMTITPVPKQAVEGFIVVVMDWPRAEGGRSPKACMGVRCAMY
jgi:hypothetical protein